MLETMEEQRPPTRTPRRALAETVLQTTRLTLEPLAVLHAERLFPMLTDPALYTFIPEDPPASVLALEKKYARWSRRGNDAGDELWLNHALFERTAAAYVGTVQATVQVDGRALLAYQIFPNAWRRGLAKEACGALLAFLRDTLEVSVVAAHCDTRNSASSALLASLGFVRVATISGADTFKGAVSDEYVYERRLAP